MTESSQEKCDTRLNVRYCNPPMHYNHCIVTNALLRCQNPEHEFECCADYKKERETEGGCESTGTIAAEE
jgi:hypothetical protein